MKIRFLLLALPLLAAEILSGADLATIAGRVALPSAPPPTVIPQRYEVVTQNGVVATSPPLAVVYLEGAFPRPASPVTVELAQKDLAFVPSLLPVQIGTRVEFTNQDDTFHNVFSFSPAKRFDLGRYRALDKPVPSQVFDTLGLVTLRCEIHKHMRGLILVLDTPYFVVTDPQGNYELPNVPPGNYVLKAWLDSKTTHSKSIVVSPGEKTHVDFP